VNVANVRVAVNDYNNEPVEVPLFQLLQWRAAIKLEAKGMKHSSGRSVTAHVRRTLSIPRSMPREDIVAFLAAVIEDVRGQLAVA
jgi:hypothetical protein